MADDPQREVLSSLPRSRPVRRSRKRSGSAVGAPEQSESAGATTTKAAAKASGAPERTAAKKPPGAAANAKADRAARKAKAKPETAAKPKTARAKAAPKSAAKTSGKAAPKSAAKAKRAGAESRSATKPQAVPPAGWATPHDAGAEPQSRLDTATTVVRAVGELAQLGVTVGGQAVKGLLSRLPKP